MYPLEYLKKIIQFENEKEEFMAKQIDDYRNSPFYEGGQNQARVKIENGEQWTNPKDLPNDIKLKLVAIRDALIAEDTNDAYHILYSIASPNFDNTDAWSAIDKLKG